LYRAKRHRPVLACFDDLGEGAAEETAAAPEQAEAPEEAAAETDAPTKPDRAIYRPDFGAGFRTASGAGEEDDAGEEYNSRNQTA